MCLESAASTFNQRATTNLRTVRHRQVTIHLRRHVLCQHHVQAVCRVGQCSYVVDRTQRMLLCVNMYERSWAIVSFTFS